MKKQQNQESINDYLDLRHQIWFVEFEIGDFGASVANLLELPQEIYDLRIKENFWAFLRLFLQKCEISFILRPSYLNKSNPDRVELALLGYWENKQFAIPLWIMKDLLLGFEIISLDNFIILDSKSLNWSPPVSLENNKIYSQYKNLDLVFLSDDIFQGQKIFFKLEKSQINVSKYFDEYKFFNRISNTHLPKSDELED
ncbi:MAG: hypothetical protein ACXADY_04960 [Candidatus Hodarchaeales archaeon]